MKLQIKLSEASKDAAEDKTVETQKGAASEAKDTVIDQSS